MSQSESIILMSNRNKAKTAVRSTPDARSAEEQRMAEEEKQNNRFSFIVGIVIAMVIIILFAIFFR